MSAFRKSVLVGGVGTFLVVTALFSMIVDSFLAVLEARSGTPIAQPGGNHLASVTFLFGVLPLAVPTLIGLVGFECAFVAKRLGAPPVAAWAAVGLMAGMLTALVAICWLRALLLAELLGSLTLDRSGRVCGAVIQAALGFWLLHSKRFAVADKSET
ncbi:MAG: hypothetical protein ABMA26_23910 [Limisphaerales bacterium]